MNRAGKVRLLSVVLVLSWLAIGYLVYENQNVRNDLERLESNSEYVSEFLNSLNEWREVNWEATKTLVGRVEVLERCSREYSSWIDWFARLQEAPLSSPRNC